MEEIFKIRNIRIEDLNNIISLLYQLSPASEKDKNTDIEVLKQTLQEIISDKNYYLCVFEYNGKIIGTGSLLIQLNLSHSGKPYGHIENIVVHREYRKRGFGRLIVYHLIKRAKEKNCYKVILNCKSHLGNFYSKLGMVESGEIEMRLNL